MNRVIIETQHQHKATAREAERMRISVQTEYQLQNNFHTQPKTSTKKHLFSAGPPRHVVFTFLY
jgi:hypothetical protein